MPFGLTELGWDDGWAAAFASYAGRGLHPARVAIEFNHIFQLYGEGREFRAEHSGRVRYLAEGRHELAAVGDWVAVKLAESGTTGTIEAVLPRRTRFSRKVAGELTQEQVVAANIDVVFIVMALDHDFNPRRLERYLLLAHESGAMPVVLLNKADLETRPEDRLAELSVSTAGVPVHLLSARGAQGLEIFDRYLGLSRTGALLGSSGVGKSTIVNALLGSSMLATQEVRASDSRGRHTTRHRQLIILPGRGVLIDTPGMRELQLWDVTTAVDDTFEDIEAFAGDCHFTNCRHQDEPRCAVKAAAERGDIAPDRLASYRKLQDELRQLEGRRDVRAQIDEKRRGRPVGRAVRQQHKRES